MGGTARAPFAPPAATEAPPAVISAAVTLLPMSRDTSHAALPACRASSSAAASRAVRRAGGGGAAAQAADPARNAEREAPTASRCRCVSCGAGRGGAGETVEARLALLYAA